MLITCGLSGIDTIDLLTANIVVIDLKYIEVLLLAVKSIFVDTDLDLGTRINLSLSPSRSFLNTHLRHTRDDSLSHAAEFFDLIDDLLGLTSQIVGKRLHHVGASPGVGNMRDACLLLNDQLSVTSNTS